MRRALWLIVNLMQACFTVAWSTAWFCIACVFTLVTFKPELTLMLARRYWAPGLLFGAGARVDLRGLENVDFGHPHVFVMNHQSVIDTAVAFRALPINLHFILKKDLMWVPVLGWFAWLNGMIFVNRRYPIDAYAALKKVGVLISGGKSVLAFPEGTRSRGAEIRAFKSGVFAAAIAAGVPIVPVAIDGAGLVLPPDGFCVRPGTIRLVLGRPVPTSGLHIRDRDALAERVRQEVVALHKTIRV